MKVAFLSVFSNCGGYSDAVTEYALALDSCGIEVVCRSISMDNTKKTLSDKMKELHSRDLNNVTHTFQYNLPSEFSYCGKTQNIGGFCYETTNFSNTNWAVNLGLMNKIIVPCSFMKEHMPKELKDRTYVVPIPLDKAKFDEKYEEMDFGLSKNCTKFYTIAEYNKRKNIPGLILSYFTAFSANDNVVLVIKTGINGLSEEDGREKLKSMISDVKKGCNRFKNPDKYPKVILITQRLSSENILSLHQTGDCYVSMSHGDAWSLPSVDALAMGNLAILPDHTAFKDYGINSCCKLIKSTKDTVFGYPNQLQLYSGNEEWFLPSAKEMSVAMQKAHQSYQDKIWDKEFFKDSAEFIKTQYSRENIGIKLVHILEN